MAEETESQEVDSLDAEITQIQTDLEKDLYKADTVEQKIAVYQSIIQKYQALKLKPELSASEIERIDKGINYFTRRIEIFDKFGRERQETSPEEAPKPNLEITWIDDKSDLHLSNFTVRHPYLAEKFSAEIQALLASKPSSPEAFNRAIDLYTKLIDILQKAIDRHKYLTEKINSAKKRNRTDTEEFAALSEERKKLGDFKSLKKFRTKFAVTREGLKTAARAYERFSGEIEKIKEKILTSIESGETKVNEKVPYVIFVNKADHEQYILTFKYDKEKRKLTLKTFNLASTGSATRWEENHTTISTTYYITHVFNPKIEGFREDYGSNFVDQDQESYKIFEMSYPEDGRLKGFQYFMHLTPEERKLGTRQSHGCLRIPRIFNADINDIYLRAFLEAYHQNPLAWDKYIKNFQSLDETNVFQPGFQIPIVVADLMGDKYADLSREIRATNTELIDPISRLKFFQSLHARYLAIAAEADREIQNLGQSSHDVLSRGYYQDYKARALLQARKLTRHIAYDGKVLEKEERIKGLQALKSETSSITDPEVQKMLNNNIDKYANKAWSDAQIEWCITMTRLVIKTYNDGMDLIAQIKDEKIRADFQKKFTKFVVKRLETSIYRNMEEVRKNAVEWIEANLLLIRHYVTFVNWVLENQTNFPKLLAAKAYFEQRIDLSHSRELSRQLTAELKARMGIKK